MSVGFQNKKTVVKTFVQTDAEEMSPNAQEFNKTAAANQSAGFLHETLHFFEDLYPHVFKVYSYF